MHEKVLFSGDVFIDQLAGERAKKLCAKFQLSRTENILIASLSSLQDPFFLFNWSISGEEYQQLKRAQNLLLSFEEFPVKLTELLQNYQKSCTTTTTNKKEATSYSMRLRSNDGKSFELGIVEENSFRSLEIVSLVLVPAGEELLREHVRAVIRQLQEQNQNLSADASNSREQLGRLSKEQEATQTAHREAVQELQSQISSLHLQLTTSKSQLDEERRNLQSTVQERDFLQVERDAFFKRKTELEKELAQRADQIETLTGQVSKLTTESEESEKELAKLQRALAIAQSSCEKQAATGAEMAQSKAALLAKVERLEGSLADFAHLKDSYERVKQQLEHAQREKSLMQRELEHQGKSKYTFEPNL